MSEPEARVDVICPKCGATFSTFLKQMAEHNQKVVCPKCGQPHRRPSAALDSPPNNPNR